MAKNRTLIKCTLRYRVGKEGKKLTWSDWRLPPEDVVREWVSRTLANCNISIRHMSSEIGFSDKEIRRWIHGEVSIRYSNMIKIVDYLLASEDITEI